MNAQPRSPSNATAQLDGEKPALRIFLSHKLGDADLAARLKQMLLDHGPSLHVFTAGEVRAGEEWERQLEKELVAADWLVLLYTSADEVWDWCLYETGFFRGKHFDPIVDQELPPRCRLICLHPGELNPPAPLKSWISVPTKKVRHNADDRRRRIPLRNWLQDIFGGGPHHKAVNPAFARDDGDGSSLAKLADEIADLVRPPFPKVMVDAFFRRLEIELTPAQMATLKSSNQLPEDTGVIAPKDTLEEVFALAANDDPARLRWDDFLSRITDETQRAWVRSIPPCIVRLNDSRLGSPFLPLLCSNIGDRGQRRSLYRPIITERQRAEGHWTRFEIVLASTPDTVQLVAAQKVDVLSHLLLLGRTFRWGILIPFIEAMERSQPDQFSDVLRRLLIEFDYALIECEARGVKVVKDIEPLLAPEIIPFYRSRVWDPWERHYAVLIECAGQLDGAKPKQGPQRNKLINKAIQATRDILDLNGLFMTVASQRLAELMTVEPLVSRQDLVKLSSIRRKGGAAARSADPVEIAAADIPLPSDSGASGAETEHGAKRRRSRKPRGGSKATAA